MGCPEPFHTKLAHSSLQKLHHPLPNFDTMIRPISLLALGAIFLGSCGNSAPEEQPSDEDMTSQDPTTEGPVGLEIQGHRGCRGLLPENTVPGFVLAIREGADVLEMDLCIAGDGSVIVSHEPWMSHEICSTPDGQRISAELERSHNLHKLTAAQIKTYDCGTALHPRFPEQRKLPAHKPTLAEVVKVTETVPLLDRPGRIRYNMEIKHSIELEPQFCPDPTTFVQKVLAEVNRLGIADRTCIQSFSAPVMEEVHKQAPDMTTAWLIESEGAVKDQLNLLTFTPDIYSPHWALIDAEDVRFLQEAGIRVIPWTVNEPEDLLTVMEMGVDGMITDYPDRLHDMR